MSQITLQIEKLTCPSCMKTIIQTTNKLKGVESTKILFDSSKARITFNEKIITEAEIMDNIVKMGYQSRKI